MSNQPDAPYTEPCTSPYHTGALRAAYGCNGPDPVTAGITAEEAAQNTAANAASVGITVGLAEQGRPPRDLIASALASTELKPPFQHCLAMADAVLAALPAPISRVAVLREAAAAVRRKVVHDGEDYCNGIDFAAEFIDRMADEAQQSTPAVTEEPK